MPLLKCGAQLVYDATDWYSALLGASRVGWSEKEIPTLMGVLPQTPKSFRRAGPTHVRITSNVNGSLPEPNNIAPQHIASLIIAAVRSGEPLVVDHLMKASQCCAVPSL